MQPSELLADHVANWVILKTYSGDIVAKLEPESAVKLSQMLLDAASLALNGSKEDE